MPCCMATVNHPHNGCWHGAKSDFPAPKGSEVSWVIGFDTAHCWDTLEMWSKQKVMQETQFLG